MADFEGAKVFSVNVDGFSLEAVGYSREDIKELCYRHFDFSTIEVTPKKLVTSLCIPDLPMFLDNHSQIEVYSYV